MPAKAKRKEAEGETANSGDTPIKILSKVINKLGMSLLEVGKKGAKGSQERIYKIGSVGEIIDAAAEKSKGNFIP